MAGVTRLELATFGVTSRRSNQLSYTPAHVYICICLSDNKDQAKIQMKDKLILKYCQ